jgi:hypothetical protein
MKITPGKMETAIQMFREDRRKEELFPFVDADLNNFELSYLIEAFYADDDRRASNVPPRKIATGRGFKVY